jgi:hypothetical protein
MDIIDTARDLCEAKRLEKFYIEKFRKEGHPLLNFGRGRRQPQSQVDRFTPTQDSSFRVFPGHSDDMG